MEIEVGEDRGVVLKKVYLPVGMETAEGHRIAVVMRDDTFEIKVMPRGLGSRMHRVDMTEATIGEVVALPRSSDPNEVAVGQREGEG